MNVGIFGLGVVGSALANYLTKTTKHKIMRVDPRLNLNDDISNCVAVFMCVPVPTIETTWEQDFSILESCMEKTEKDQIVFIRSTVLPSTCDRLSKKFDRNVISLPEFLTQRYADFDMETIDICSGAKNDANAQEVLTDHFPNKQIKHFLNLECELGKFYNNVNGATSVHISSIMYQMACQYGVSYENVLMAGNTPKYLGQRYRSQPGHDGLPGFGGECFPKDLKSFAMLTKLESLKHIVIENDFLRSKS